MIRSQYVYFAHVCAPVVLGLALPLLGGCQVLAKTESRSADPLVTGCTLPKDGDARIRVVNLVPDAQAVDFCIRETGGTYARPLLRGGGLDCPNGYAYESASAVFAVPSGSVDIKTIQAGLTCSAPSLSEAKGIAVSSAATVTIARFGGSGATEQLTPFVDTSSSDATNAKLRFINAIPGSKPLYIGLTKDARLPTDVEARLLTIPVPFGASPSFGDTATIGAIDANGYLVIAPNNYEMGAAEDGATKALLVADVPNHASAYTLFAIGDPNDLEFPERGLLCEDAASNGITTTCTETSLPTISIDVFNVGLYGANAPDEAGRRPYLEQAIAKRDADLQCLLEVGRGSDRDAIAQAAKSGGLAYNFAPTTDRSTLPTDPTDSSGATPVVPTSVSCAESQAVDDAYACMADQCSTIPGDPNGTIAGTTDCLSSHCAVKLAPLFAGNASQQRCFDCIADTVTSDMTYAQSKTACTTDPGPAIAFEGQNPSMILSRYPLAKTDVLVLPSTNFRRTILYTQVQLSQGTTVDFYCGQLSSPLLDADLPYTGGYSGGDVSHGYDNEQKLQTNKLIAWVQKKSGNRPAIITGDWHSSMAFSQNGTKAIDDLNPDTIAALRGAFSEATAPSWTPTCTYCPGTINPYNGSFKVGYAFSETYLFNWPDKATTDESILYNQPINTANGSEMLSPSFGLNVRVIRP